MERTTAKMPLRVKKHRLSPVKTIVLGYVVIILTGALLLTLPISTRDWVWTSFGNALFTATSATCVTGLVVFDTYTYWSVFGQIVIILLIQIGGIGFMTLAISALTLTKRSSRPLHVTGIRQCAASRRHCQNDAFHFIRHGNF